MKDWIVIGKFGRPHGIQGLIKVFSFTDPLENLIEYEPKYIGINNDWQKVTFKKLIPKDKYFLALIQNYNTRDEVSFLTNIEIAIKKEQLPKLDANEYYWHQLIGLKVINQNNTLLGQVIEVLPTGSNDVLIVKGEKRILIPYRPEIIKEINENQISVDWDLEF